MGRGGGQSNTNITNIMSHYFKCENYVALEGRARGDGVAKGTGKSHLQ